ncbi:hypothetical protein ALP76_05214 [Pseudomonas savastanoi pv. glycinea]|uniref:Amino acid adenylation n=1 Tax=Pseudomonas savastanoi pv. glycinea TaxID=318 RepID=A0A3M4YK44_PSESG|nr:Amino acid adenylation [Pseudomonas savastanoi pv. glycinea]RMR88483.1 hypothetical protein ALP76_05214 [Pseudomonas savastanoi pv. glycinea]
MAAWSYPARGARKLFEVSVSYELEDHDYCYGEAEAHTVKVSNGYEATPLAIHLRTNSYNDDAALHLVHHRAWIEDTEAQAIAGRLLHILEQGLESPTLKLQDFHISAPAEQLQIQAWNQTEKTAADEQLIHRRIKQQARIRPYAVAAVYQGQHLTYAQLNRQANALAQRLIYQGVRPDDRVAIVSRRSLETLVGLLAVLKAGAAYVPIDPSHPRERLHYLLSDSAPVVVLTLSTLIDRLPPLAMPLIELDHCADSQGADNNPLVVGLSSDNLVYVIYTSGSTGQPKGVMVEHRTLANLVDWHCSAFDVKAGSHTSSLAGFGFDAMAWEVWPTLCAGATLHLAPVQDSGEDIEAMLNWWRAQPLDVSFLPTPVAEYAFSQDEEHPTLRTLLIGGDRLRQFVHNRRYAVVNNYGPTETTVFATSGQILANGSLHIGGPIANTRVYVLDEQLQPMPVGVAGELYIGGAGVARGYLNQPQLTEERFVVDPFSDVEQARMYRSGDLVRWNADGTLDYLGRNDDQVKIRGMRIELGEIEAMQAGLEGVKDAVVLVRDLQLLAWFTETSALDTDALSPAMRARLPGYMVPRAFTRLASLPLTANGKLDRRALPDPAPAYLLGQAYEAPKSEVEIAMAAIWARVLGVERVGRHDNFFELGGHSLLAVNLVEQLRKAGLTADVYALLSQPTLAALAAWQNDAANVQEIYPLAPLQEGILYHHLTAGDSDPYLLQPQFAFADVSRLNAFCDALQRVIERNDMLRTVLFWEGLQTPVQVVWRQAPMLVQETALHDLFNAPRMDLTQAPLLHLVYAHDPANHRIAAVLRYHHVIMDHIALDVLSHELQAVLLGNEASLVAPVPYRNYIAHVLQGPGDEAHEAFFREQLGDVDEPTLPYGLVMASADQIPGEARLTLDIALCRQVRDQARQLSVSAATLMHLAWAQVLGQLSGRDSMVFGTVLLGRLRGGEGGERALGVFINTLPLRMDLGGHCARSAVLDLHARLVGMLTHEHAQLALAQRCSALPAGAPLFNTLLNYRHSAVPEVDDQASNAAWQGIEVVHAEERSNYPLTLCIDDFGDAFSLTAQTAPGIDPQRICAYVQQALVHLVQALEQQSETALIESSVLPEAEHALLSATFNNTRREYPREQLVHRLFERRAALHPHAVAAVHGRRSLTYGELNERANHLAHYLLGQGVKPNEHVAILLPRSLELVISQLAIGKCAATYVPLDVNAPAERQHYMLDDCQAKYVLTQSAMSTGSSVRRIDLDRLTLDDQPAHDPGLPQASDTEAYVMYTSGSTGAPKGVRVAHRGVT